MSSNVWTDRQIGEWGEKTFGRPANALSLIDRADLEFTELKELTHYMSDTEPLLREERFVPVDAVLEEMADVVIVLKQAAYYLGSDLEDIIAKKMIKNVHRKWVITGDGVGRHI